MNSYRNRTVLAVLLLTGVPLAHAADYVFDAHVPKIDKQYLYLDDGEKFPMAADSSPYGQRVQYRFRTACYTEQNHKITCETLFGVGYIDRARITIEHDAVKAIRVIELQQ